MVLLCGVSAISAASDNAVDNLTSDMDDSFLRLLCTTIAGVICAGGSILYIGCKRDERQMILGKIQRVIKKKLVFNDKNRKSS